MEKYISPEIEIIKMEIEDIATDILMTSMEDFKPNAFETEEDTFGLFTK